MLGTDGIGDGLDNGVSLEFLIAADGRTDSVLQAWSG